ncbi:CH domain-containing protein [Hamiltosporidium tvaerminnensis]|uniref:CH domain-containing protein n=2 Tax=Hamiltosporidium TaxID=1176354 RepID=A0A4Q9LHW3_9MICR|nr:CH domain-containing protein [Hamiltosporidium tvaerminnensis]TBT98387.1 CH domain-containing protein [Hamiltosporidium magnivora]TBU06801.1 CH domain-containing protein [Hamiltosporidium magnivora]
MEKEQEEIINWINTLLTETNSPSSLQDFLKDGIILCKLANKISPGTCKYTESKMKFKQMENINAFLDSARKLGVPEYELFLTVDLIESKNIKQVVNCLYSLSRNVQKSGIFDGPFIGPKLYEKRNIEFSQEALDRGNVSVYKQMGSYVDFSKYTLTDGVRRQITDSLKKKPND